MYSRPKVWRRVRGCASWAGMAELSMITWPRAPGRSRDRLFAVGLEFLAIVSPALGSRFLMILALRARAAFLTIAVVAMLLPGGCGGSSATKSSAGSFLGKASNAVILIQWTRSGNAVSGSLQQTLLADPAGSGVSTQQISFTGLVAGNGLTLQLSKGLGTTTSLVGTLSGSGFMLTYPGNGSNLIQVRFTPGQISGYTQAVSELRVSQYSSPCTLYLQDHDATVTISGPDAAADCDAFVQGDSSDTWTTQAQGASSDSQVCDLVSGADEVVVGDDGAQTYGQRVCSTFTDQGWSPKPSSAPAGTVTSTQCPSSGADAGRLPDGTPCVGPPGTG